jgi:ketosteroid isomerase-like protein
MTDDRTAAVVRKHVEAFNDGDLERLLAGFAEDALWITGQTVVRGRNELTSLFGDAIDGLRPHLAVENLITEHGRAACQLTETLLFEHEQRSYSIAVFFRLHDGLITSAKVYREGSAEVA